MDNRVKEGLKALARNGKSGTLKSTAHIRNGACILDRTDRMAHCENSREELCASLQKLGVNAQMAECGRIEEGITFGRGRGRTFFLAGG